MPCMAEIPSRRRPHATCAADVASRPYMARQPHQGPFGPGNAWPTDLNVNAPATHGHPGAQDRQPHKPRHPDIVHTLRMANRITMGHRTDMAS